MSISARVFAVAAVLVLSGCASQDNSRIHRLDNERSFTTAADERVVLRVPNRVDAATGRLQPEYISCAEPSPDIARLLSQSSQRSGELGAGLPTGVSASVAFGFAKGQAEGMAQLTERLASIQILRDGMYRACEAYANGAIDRMGYALVLAHSERLMFGLLMGELMAARPPPPLLAIGAGSTAESPKEQAEAQKLNVMDAAAGTTQALGALQGVVKKLQPGLLTRVGSAADVEKLPVSVLPVAARPLARDVINRAAQQRSEESTLGSLLSQSTKAVPGLGLPGAAAPRKPGKSSPGASSSTSFQAPAGGQNRTAGSSGAQVDGLLQLSTAFLNRPTLDGIEVACFTLLADPQLAARNQQLNDYCRQAVRDILAYKLAVNRHPRAN